jgi:hypothetical protein
MGSIIFDYKLSSEWNRRTQTVDLRGADEMTLRYDCFLGDVVFSVDEADFSARWDWVPVFDFALSLRAIDLLPAGVDRLGRLFSSLR